MYYTVIKHSGHLRTLDKCRTHSPASLVFSNARRVLSQCNTRLRFLYLLSILLSPELHPWDNKKGHEGQETGGGEGGLNEVLSPDRRGGGRQQIQKILIGIKRDMIA